ncbi:MAG: D-alanyl-D-alanine carboxypeptidase [Clostridia bacterium]|nr:D-alanyl-D-alanine carboxypeptidase [Clostridia bacterium]
MRARRFPAFLLALLLFVLPATALPVSAAPPAPEIAAKNAILLEASTGRVLYEKEADTPLPPASITKVMTVLLLAEAVDEGRVSLDDVVTVSGNAAAMGGSQVYLETGEQMSLRDLLKSVVVASGNDAAVAVAEALAGSEESFVAQMNERAAELGLLNTHFVNSHGLDAEGHLCSARDIALMSATLLHNHPWITEYTTIWMDSLRDGAFTLSNTNKLIRTYPGATGLKTGTTTKAGCCLAASAERDGMVLIAVVMGTANNEERFAAASALLDYGYANYKLVSFPFTAPAPIAVKGGKQDLVPLTVTEEAVTVVMEQGDARTAETVPSVQQELTAPVEKGQTVGEAVLMLGDEEIGRAKVVTAQEVLKRTLLDELVRCLRVLSMVGSRAVTPTSLFLNLFS